MKKSDIALIICVVVIVGISAFLSVGNPVEKVVLTSLDFSQNDEKEYEENAEEETGFDGYISIDYEEYSELLKGEDYFFIVIGRTGCSYCEKFKPVLDEVANKLDLPLHYIDIDDMDEDELKEFSISNSFLRENEWGTPTTLILNKDKVLASQQGYVEADELEEFIKKYIKLDGEE